MDKLGKNDFIECLNYMQLILKHYDDWGVESKRNIQNDLNRIEAKLNDENLYLGVIGTFSSGKSTFINSVVNANILPTDAIQGTTVTETILKKAAADDLQIVYSNGTKLRYSENKKSLVEKYLSDSEKIMLNKNRSIFAEILNWIKALLRKIFGKDIIKFDNVDIQTMQKIFKIVISTESLATDIEYACLEINNEKIVHNIALVDTPGTESLNKRHNEVTMHAINVLCDAIIIIIPYDEPVSESLLEYIKTNLAEKLESCIYVVTKIELLDDMDELPRLIKVINQRLRNGLGIHQPVVIPMPTLLELEENCQDMKKTGLLDNMDQEIKGKLLASYSEGLDIIYDILLKNKARLIKNKLLSICNELFNNLELNIKNEIGIRDTNIQKLVNKQIKGLDEFNNEVNILLDQRKQVELARLGNINSETTVNVSDLQTNFINNIEQCEKTKKIIEVLVSPNGLADIIEKNKQNFISVYLESEKKYKETIATIDNKIKSYYGECNIVGCCGPIEKQELDYTDMNAIGKKGQKEFNECLNSLKTELENDTSGIFRRFVSWLTDSTNKHKKLCISGITDVLSKINSSIITVNEKKWEQQNSGRVEQIKSKLQQWEVKNKPIILSYATNNHKEIVNNTLKKEEALNYLTELDKYMAQLKE